MRVMKTRRILLASTALVLGLFLGACGGDMERTDTSAPPAPAGGGDSISLSAVDNEFEPAELSVGSGEITVDFTNDGETVHTFTSEELGFDSGNVDPGESASVTFTAPDGPIEFVCTIHESTGMVGTISPK